MKRSARNAPGSPLWNHYRCRDEKWLALALTQADRYWPIICNLLGIEQYESDPRFSNMEVRRENSRACVEILDEAFSRRNRDEWLNLFRKGDIICAPVFTTNDVVDDNQAMENGYLTRFDHPVWGEVKWVGSPVSFSKMACGPRHEAPELGQHTEEILLEIGYKWDDIEKLRRNEVI
jgi:crotonobetainyl-CoA:carnitine CoA-transferase CaiB-like acyl-CoA transferase